MTLRTPGRASSWLTLKSRSSPITAITVRSTPYNGTGWRPLVSRCLRIFSTFSFSVPLSITIIMFLLVKVLGMNLVSIGVRLGSKGYVDCLLLHVERAVFCSFHFFWVKNIKKSMLVLAWVKRFVSNGRFTLCQEVP